MKTQTKLLAGVVTVLIMAGNIFAEPPEGESGFDRPGGGPRMPMPMRQQGEFGMMQRQKEHQDIIQIIIHRLDPNDQQCDKIETILKENRNKMADARDAVEKARRGLEDAVKNDANDTVIRDAAKTIGNAIADEAILKVKTVQQIKAVLTPEQLKQLKEILASNKDHQRYLRRAIRDFERPAQSGPRMQRPMQPQ